MLMDVDLNMAFAARCLIRLVSLIPDGVNTRQIGRDVEKIAQALSQGGYTPTSPILCVRLTSVHCSPWVFIRHVPSRRP